MHFASPHYLWLLTLLAPMIAYYVWRTMQGGAAIQISTVEGVARAPKSVRYYLRHLPFALRAAAFGLLVVALARPQQIEQNVRTSSEGIDIMLAIDVSASMLARDFEPDRITAAKEVAGSFISDRYGDRIGLCGGLDMNELIMNSYEVVYEKVLREGTEFRRKARGYALGSGNSIPDYMSVDGYRAMIDAVQEIRRREKENRL